MSFITFMSCVTVFCVLAFCLIVILLQTKTEDKTMSNLPNGDRFIELGNKFIEIHKKQKLNANNLDFGETEVEKEECGTVACHGGWGVALFSNDLNENYEQGANYIAKFLGFKYILDFTDWACDNEELWGNDRGEEMFDSDGYVAFGFDSPGICTLLDIGLHYIAVGERIKKESQNESC